MKTVFEIITEMYELLNVDQVTDLLTDGIFRNKRGEESKGTCIVVAPLTHVNPENVVNEGVMNVNIHAPNLSDNTVDETTLQTIVERVVALIEAHVDTDNYLIFEFEGQNVIADERDQTFVNLRVNYFCEQ
jgi:hypothetical protein